jgi:hypothetical protein
MYEYQSSVAIAVYCLLQNEAPSGVRATDLGLSIRTDGVKYCVKWTGLAARQR